MIDINTPAELLNITIAEIAGEVNWSDINITSDLVMTLKIDGEEWQDAKYIDYKSALIIEALQKDFLGFYNDATGSKITLSDLDKFKELIIKVQIKDGCIEYIVRGIKYITDFSKDMNPKQKLILVGLVLGIVASGSMPWATSNVAKAWRDVQLAKYQHQTQVIKCIEKAEKILAANKRTQKIIAEYSSNQTSISIGGDDPISAEDLKSYVDDTNKSVIPETHYIDGNYTILKYDFDNQRAHIRLGKKREWVSTEFLESADREKIKELAGKAIDEGRSQRADLQISIQVLNGEIIRAAIMGLGSPRKNSKKVTEALKLEKKNNNTRPKQATLLEPSGSSS